MNLRHSLATSHTSGARSTRSKGVALAVLATAQLVIALDYSIVNMALPDVGRSLGFSGGTVQWVISAYALTFGRCTSPSPPRPSSPCSAPRWRCWSSAAERSRKLAEQHEMTAARTG
jgi:hypothetical protein